MQIERELVPVSTLEAFADAHGLVMQIRERKFIDLPRFIASFKSAEVKDGIMLSSRYGDGDTEEQAIRNYARHISLQRLVISAYGQDRREIDVPRLTP